MKAKGRFSEARLFLGAGTVALLLGTWSALTVHDSQANKADTASTTNTTNVVTTTNRTLPTTSSQTTSSPSRQTTTIIVPRTRTRGS